jgi:hypothetical protein
MKKIMNILTAILLTAVLMPACTGEFEDINTDPDALNYAPHTNILAYVLRYTADQFGNDIDGYGTYDGYISKIQYMDNLEGVVPTNNSFGNRWHACYVCNEQLRVVLEKTEDSADGLKNLRWVCRIVQLQMWLFMIDQYGDMPYSEALKGADDLGGIYKPKYDSERDIYPDLLSKLKAVGDEMSGGFGSDHVGDGDILFRGDMNRWQRFCNSLRLRGAMRLSGVAPDLARTHIEEIAGNPSKYPLIDSNGVNAFFKWSSSLPYVERWYDNSRGRDDHGFFDTFIEHLLDMEDPRIQTIAKPAVRDGVYRGFQNGSSVTPSDLGMYSRICRVFRDIPDGTTPYYRSCETYYIFAEAAMLGWNVGMTAQEAYEKAVRLSMEEMEISNVEAETYLAGKGKWDNTKERIYWDLWVALFKENMEAWSLYRRTGIPAPEVNYVSLLSRWGRDAHNSQPFRTQYPAREDQYNRENYNKANEGIVDYVWGKQLWWDTRQGVY